MRTVRRITLAASLAAMVVTGIAIGHTAGAAPRAAATQHSITMRGVQWRSLDFRYVPQYIQQHGGGVYLQRLPGATSQPDAWFLEADMNLPAGALVNQVTFFYQDCGVHGNALAHWYFARYDPAHAGGGFILQSADSPVGTRDCQTHAFVRNVSPAVKVDPTKNYVAGVDSGYANNGDDPTTSPSLVVLGAKVRYTCPNGC
jgi:hypothetical protein